MFCDQTRALDNRASFAIIIGRTVRGPRATREKGGQTPETLVKTSASLTRNLLVFQSCVFALHGGLVGEIRGECRATGFLHSDSLGLLLERKKFSRRLPRFHPAAGVPTRDA